MEAAMMNISDTRDCAFEAFITNLGKYNEGFLVGEWVKFPVTKPQITDNENGTGELNVQIGTLVVQIVAVQLIHQLHTLGFGEVGVLLLQVLPPVVIVNVVAPNDVSAVLHCVRPSLSAVGVASLGVIGWKKKKTEKEDAE